MAEEIFARPVVKKVVFQARFPNLFFIDNSVGEFQKKIMRDFPESSLLLRNHIFLVSKVSKPDEQEQRDESALPDQASQKIWQFKNRKGVVVNITRDSVSISSEKHTSYSLGETDKFRDIVETVCTSFFDVVGVPIATRVGLRYINECPIFEQTSKWFSTFYDSPLPVGRFPLDTALEMEFKVTSKTGAESLRHAESIELGEGKASLTLDLDAWAEGVEVQNILTTTDRLHDLVAAEFMKTAKEPFLDYMRTKTEGK